MFESIKKYKNILVIVTIVVVAFVAYSMFFAGRDITTNILTSSTVGPGIQSSVNSELLLLLINLKSIRLNDSLFGDPAFKELRDYGQDLVPEPLGRENPFSPIDSD